VPGADRGDARVVMLALCALGCQNEGSFQGTVAGNDLKVKQAIFFLPELRVLIGDQDRLCQALGQRIKSLTLFQLQFARVELGPHAVPAEVTATFTRTDGTCEQIVSAADGTGRAGTIELRELTESRAVGEFEVLFGAKDVVKGTFNASYCDATFPTEQSGECM
jgi:hypothetical protein